MGVAPFEERWRDTHDFARRAARLPEQREEDLVDYRGLLHRDGSVLSAVSLQVGLLQQWACLPGSWPIPLMALCCSGQALRVC